MASAKIGDKEAQVRALRETRAQETAADRRHRKAVAALPEAEVEKLRALESAIMAGGAEPKERPVKKKAKAKKKSGLHPAIKSVSSTDHKTIRIERKKPAAAKKARKASVKAAPVPALDVANFMARPVGHKDAPLGGASMLDLVARFNIEPHPMRAKIHYVRNQMAGWDVELRDGRYHATFKQPK